MLWKLWNEEYINLVTIKSKDCYDAIQPNKINALVKIITR